MISDFHLERIKKCFPCAYDEFIKTGAKETWKELRDWIESKGFRRNHYSVELQKIENDITYRISIKNSD